MTKTKTRHLKAPPRLADVPELAAKVAELDALLVEVEAAGEAVRAFTPDTLKEAQAADQAAFTEAAAQGKPDPGRKGEQGWHRGRAEAEAGELAAVEAAKAKRAAIDQAIAEHGIAYLENARAEVTKARGKALRSVTKALADVKAYELAISVERTLEQSVKAGQAQGASTVTLSASAPYAPPATTVAGVLTNAIANLSREPGEPVRSEQQRPKPKAKQRGLLSYEVTE